jgi:septum formation protein
VPPLVLASRSPQRRAILGQLGLDFEVVVPEVEELEQGPPDSVALENARRKAAAVVAPGDALILGVDTVVVLDGRIYGKPADEAEARSTLTALSGQVHTVVSGVCVAGAGVERTAIARTEVTMAALSDGLLDWYLATEEWRERAGGYAIQGAGAALVQRIDGDYSNVVGLPVSALLELVPELLVRPR